MSRPVLLLLLLFPFASCSFTSGLAHKNKSQRLRHDLATRAFDRPVPEIEAEEDHTSGDRTTYLVALSETLTPIDGTDRSELPSSLILPEKKKSVLPPSAAQRKMEGEVTGPRRDRGNTPIIGSIPVPQDRGVAYRGLDEALKMMTSGLMVLLPLAFILVISMPASDRLRIERDRTAMVIAAGSALAALVALAMI